MKTIGVDLWGDQVRGGGGNSMTCLGPSSRTRARRGFRELFIAAYESFAERCREVAEPGVAVVAIDEANGRSLGLLRLLARVGRHGAAIIGRHDECDLFLNAHQRLALRHLAVVVDPVTDWRPGANVRYRVFDLRTTDGFRDEHDRSLRGLRCEGPGMLRCGGYALFFFPLGDPTDWPPDAEEAWAFLPERVYFDELARPADGSLPHPRMPRASNIHEGATQRSLLVSTHGPRDSTSDNLLASGDVAGTLELIGPRNRGTIRIGHQELRDGVLIGRYARCNNAQLADDPSMSRVHALLLQIEDAIVAIDTASLNGTREANRPKARLIQLSGDTELVLGTATRARWHWVS